MKLVFDIGFNTGEFTTAILLRYDECEVVAVEANSSLLIEISAGHPRLTLLNRAASNVADLKIDFYVDPWQTGISTASKDYVKNSRFAKGSKYIEEVKCGRWLPPRKVKTITLDKMIEDYGDPCLIKVDVEGYEKEVLQGLSKKSGMICFEWHEEAYDDLKQTVEHLQSIGYQEFGIIGFFDEGDIFERCTFNRSGDPYLTQPKKYFEWELIKKEMDVFIDHTRRVNYGMMWCK